MYDLGILGGMGSEATETLFHRILSCTETQKDQDFPEIVILNKSGIPDRSAYLLGKSEENPLPALQEGIRELNLLPVGRIALPCNTAHAFYEDIQAVSDFPVINMLESSLEYIYRIRPGARVCILGTLGTVQTRVYERYNHFPLEICYPDEACCEEVHALIYDIKTGIHDSSDDFAARLAGVMERTAAAEKAPQPVFLLACTELSVLGVDCFPDFSVLDALDIAAQVAVAAGSKKLKAFGPYDAQVITEIAARYR
ncbi:MAG: amino acid racemase [Clostridiales bacterium]|nr:amino acid racemase [Clostridiales bacterium]